MNDCNVTVYLIDKSGNYASSSINVDTYKDLSAPDLIVSGIDSNHWVNNLDGMSAQILMVLIYIIKFQILILKNGVIVQKKMIGNILRRKFQKGINLFISGQFLKIKIVNVRKLQRNIDMMLQHQIVFQLNTIIKVVI